MSSEVAFLISQLIGLGVSLLIIAVVNMKWPGAVSPFFFSFGYTLTGCFQFWLKFLR